MPPEPESRQLPARHLRLPGFVLLGVSALTAFEDLFQTVDGIRDRQQGVDLRLLHMSTPHRVHHEVLTATWLIRVAWHPHILPWLTHSLAQIRPGQLPGVAVAKVPFGRRKLIVSAWRAPLCGDAYWSGLSPDSGS